MRRLLVLLSALALLAAGVGLLEARRHLAALVAEDYDPELCWRDSHLDALMSGAN